MGQLQVVEFSVDKLTAYHKNPRRGDVAAIAESLKARGQYRPIVVNVGSLTGRENEILAGNHTVAAARFLGWSSVQATTVDVDDEAAAQIVLAENRIADLGTYDDSDLLAVLQSAGSLDGTGYSDADLAELSAALDTPVALTDPDDVPDLPDEGDVVSRAGDVWSLGPHRLVVGSATDEGVLRSGFPDGGVADCMWTDPPYGVSYVGKTKDALTIQGDTVEGLRALLDESFAAALTVLRAGAPCYVAHADSERVTFEGALVGAGYLVRQNLIWVKNAIVLGRSDYQYKHEPVLEVDAPDDDALTHDPLLYGFTPGGEGRLGRGGPRWAGDNKQSTVFEIPKPSRSKDHPTMKPVELVAQMLRNSARAGQTVLDLFAGSGSTLIAAHQLGLRAVLVELDPKYADVICRRWQQHTGQVPVRDGRPVGFLDEG